MELTEAQKRAASLIEDIQDACIKHGLNMALYDGGIGFVDQESLTIVAVWRPSFRSPDQGAVDKLMNTERKE